MKFLALATLILTSSAFAQSQNFHCKATYNLETVVNEKVSLDKSPVTFGSYEAFKFHLQKKADGRVELQASNMDEPSRSYATSNIKNAGDNVELSVWTNFYMMEVHCTHL
jgi:hypothetical protein